MGKTLRRNHWNGKKDQKDHSPSKEVADSYEVRKLRFLLEKHIDKVNIRDELELLDDLLSDSGGRLLSNGEKF